MADEKQQGPFKKGELEEMKLHEVRRYALSFGLKQTKSLKLSA